ncbi:tyrosine-type recombinase/integrase [Pigmentiphaga sp. YJ18]|uniref:tyrosine-type recombinase/integrase n=1 Tax=Pigmentiphaga sp. YJ18 TaxID=3134907 RepID=UPI003117B34E
MPDQSTISRHFRAAREAVGMDWLHFHDLRHSATSEMINREIDLYTVGAVLGHKSAQSTKRYAHLATAALRKAVGEIGKKSPPPHRRNPRQMPRNPRQYLVGLLGVEPSTNGL